MLRYCYYSGCFHWHSLDCDAVAKRLGWKEKVCLQAIQGQARFKADRPGHSLIAIVSRGTLAREACLDLTRLAFVNAIAARVASLVRVSRGTLFF